MKKVYLSLIIACVCFSQAIAQQNIVKLNALSLLFTNISVQYERSLNGHSSVALGFSYLPDRSLPSFVTSKDEGNNAEDFTFGGISVTPEYRYYFKGEGPKGFYVSGYYRYSKYTTDHFKFSFDNSNGTTSDVDMSGDYTISVVGIMFGSQYLLGDKWTLDWWIIGAGFGSQKGEYIGTGDFTGQDQADFIDEVNSIDTPALDVTAEASNTEMKISFEPKFPAVRGFGLCVGYRF